MESSTTPQASLVELYYNKFYVGPEGAGHMPAFADLPPAEVDSITNSLGFARYRLAADDGKLFAVLRGFARPSTIAAQKEWNARVEKQLNK